MAALALAQQEAGRPELAARSAAAAAELATQQRLGIKASDVQL
jgi:hypothetical protein